MSIRPPGEGQPLLPQRVVPAERKGLLQRVWNAVANFFRSLFPCFSAPRTLEPERVSPTPPPCARLVETVIVGRLTPPPIVQAAPTMEESAQKAKNQKYETQLAKLEADCNRVMQAELGAATLGQVPLLDESVLTADLPPQFQGRVDAIHGKIHDVHRKLGELNRAASANHNLIQDVQKQPLSTKLWQRIVDHPEGSFREKAVEIYEERAIGDVERRLGDQLGRNFKEDFAKRLTSEEKKTLTKLEGKIKQRADLKQTLQALADAERTTKTERHQLKLKQETIEGRQKTLTKEIDGLIKPSMGVEIEQDLDQRRLNYLAELKKTRSANEELDGKLEALDKAIDAKTRALVSRDRHLDADFDALAVESDLAARLADKSAEVKSEWARQDQEYLQAADHVETLFEEIEEYLLESQVERGLSNAEKGTTWRGRPTFYTKADRAKITADFKKNSESLRSQVAANKQQIQEYITKRVRNRAELLRCQTALDEIKNKRAELKSNLADLDTRKKQIETERKQIKIDKRELEQLQIKRTFVEKTDRQLEEAQPLLDELHRLCDGEKRKEAGYSFSGGEARYQEHLDSITGLSRK